MLRIEAIQQIVEPIKKQVTQVVTVQVHFDFLLRLDGTEIVDNCGEQPLGRLDEKLIQIRCPDAQSQVRRMLEGLVHLQ